jgi:predicted enzyme related to lactoylglutathione lyase
MPKLVWAILMSRDVAGAKAFYKETLGWRFEMFTTEPFPTWVARSPEGRSVAVFVDSSASDFPDAPELWLPYFLVEDLDAQLRQAEALGATLLRPPLAISAAGRIALLRQPAGAIVGWISASPAG